MAKQSPKGLAALIIASKKPSKEEMPMEGEMDMESEEDSSVELESAAEEIFMAIDQKDPKALVSALKSFIEMC
jgi:hypothetical protein